MALEELSFETMALKELSFESVNRKPDRWMDNGQKVITIAHPEHSSGELKIPVD